MDAWTRIETWLEANCPSIAEDLAEPVTDEELRSAEAALSVTIPPEMAEVYRRHNGQRGDADPLAGEWQFLSLEGVVQQWQIQKKVMAGASFANAATPRGPVKPVWWSPRWVPVMYDGAGNLQCVDTDPAEGGNVGQVVTVWHDQEFRECVAISLTEWLEQLARDLEGGRYEVLDDGLVRK